MAGLVPQEQNIYMVPTFLFPETYAARYLLYGGSLAPVRMGPMGAEIVPYIKRCVFPQVEYRWGYPYMRKLMNPLPGEPFPWE